MNNSAREQTFDILTAVPQVCLNYNKPNEIVLDRMTVEAAEQYIVHGNFVRVSLLPKVKV